MLDALGEMFGFPYRPYTAEEWAAAYEQEGIIVTHNQLIIAEAAARQCGDIVEADRLQALRWERAMGLVINTENTQQGKRSARQTAASRESVGRGKIRPRKPQKDPGGLFEHKEPEQPDSEMEKK